MNPHDEYREDAAAYLLGALDADAQRAFEAHLADCPQCTAAVAELRPALDLLAQVQAADLLAADSTPEPGPPLLPALLAAAATRQRRRRWGIAALGSVAAAALIALAVALGTQPGSGHPAVTARAMTPVSQDVPLRATATLTGEHWGTEISLDCSYATAGAYSGTYRLEVVGRDGAHQLLGSWNVQSAGHTRFTSGVALTAGEIGSVRIDLPDGTPVLQLTP